MKNELRTSLISALTALVFVLVSSYFQNFIARPEFSEHEKSYIETKTILIMIKDDVGFIKSEIIDHLKEKHP